MKKLFARLPMIGLILGVLAIASDIMAQSQETHTTIFVQESFESPWQSGYLALIDA